MVMDLDDIIAEYLFSYVLNKSCYSLSFNERSPEYIVTLAW